MQTPADICIVLTLGIMIVKNVEASFCEDSTLKFVDFLFLCCAENFQMHDSLCFLSKRKRQQ